MDRFRTVSLFLLRVASGFLFLQHGGQKIFGWFGGMPGGATAQAFTAPWIGGVLEFFGGFLLLIGLFTQPVAFVLSGEMAVAYFLVHQPNGLLPIQNHGELAVLFSFIFLFFAAHGAGEWSLDAMRARGRGAAPRREALVN